MDTRMFEVIPFLDCGIRCQMEWTKVIGLFEARSLRGVHVLLKAHASKMALPKSRRLRAMEIRM